MKQDRAEVKYQRFCKRLQEAGFNARESRCCRGTLPRFKALDLAPRSHIPLTSPGKGSFPEHELNARARSTNGLLEDLRDLYSEGKSGRETLDFFRIGFRARANGGGIPPDAVEGKVEYPEFSR